MMMIRDGEVCVTTKLNPRKITFKNQLEWLREVGLISSIENWSTQEVIDRDDIINLRWVDVWDGKGSRIAISHKIEKSDNPEEKVKILQPYVDSIHRYFSKSMEQ